MLVYIIYKYFGMPKNFLEMLNFNKKILNKKREMGIRPSPIP